MHPIPANKKVPRNGGINAYCPLSLAAFTILASLSDNESTAVTADGNNFESDVVRKIFTFFRIGEDDDGDLFGVGTGEGGNLVCGELARAGNTFA